MNNMEVRERASSREKRSRWGCSIIPLLLLFAVATLWLFAEVGRIKLPVEQWRIVMLSSQVERNAQAVESLDSRVTASENAITTIANGVDSNASDIRTLAHGIDSNAGDISALASYVDAVAAVADNANMYAHSHSYSDIRLKRDLQPVHNALEGVAQLNPVFFRWRFEDYPDIFLDDDQHVGLIAQEVEALYPQLVFTDARGLKSIDYEQLTPILLQAIKEQQLQIRSLQTETDALNARLSELEEAFGQSSQP